jgi:hypothetical protein
MEHPKYELPTMLYHVGEGEKVFTTQESVEDALDNKGWSRTPNQMSKAEGLRNKIAYHRAQVKIFQSELDDMLLYKGDDTEYKCDVCGRDCKNKLGLLSHKRVHEKASEEE